MNGRGSCYVTPTMPSFSRITWVSARARLAWEDRLGVIAEAWRQIEWQSVAVGVRRAALVTVAAEDFEARADCWRGAGLSVLPVELRLKAKGYASRHAPVHGSGPLEFGVALTTAAALNDFKTVWERQDQLGIADLLGYPPCCASAFCARFARHGMRDTTWPMAVATSAAQREDRHTITIAESCEGNVLLRWLRVRSVPHLPCRFDCPATIAFGCALSEVGREQGHGAAMDMVEQVLRWPVEWSALHGLAEIRTPVCRVVADTDISTARHVVRIAGTAWPEEGAQGLAFPYRNMRPDRYTGSTGFQRGLQNQS